MFLFIYLDLISYFIFEFAILWYQLQFLGYFDATVEFQSLKEEGGGEGRRSMKLLKS